MMLPDSMSGLLAAEPTHTDTYGEYFTLHAMYWQVNDGDPTEEVDVPEPVSFYITANHIIHGIPESHPAVRLNGHMVAKGPVVMHLQALYVAGSADFDELHAMASKMLGEVACINFP